jgi:uncharacterized protein YjbI with pentapeptide repeats
MNNITSALLEATILSGQLISNFNITDDLYISDNFPNNCRFQNCNFQSVCITCTEKKRFSFIDCSFNEIDIEGNTESFILINARTCEKFSIHSTKSNSIRITDSNIEEVYFNLFCGDSITIDSLFIIESNINKITLAGNIKRCYFHANSVINEILISSKLEYIIISKQKFTDENLVECTINNLTINNEILECILYKVNINNVLVNANERTIKLDVKESHLSNLHFINNFKNDGRVYISNSTIKDEISFRNCEINYFTISRMNLNKTRFILHDSFITNLRWYNVIWSSNLSFYKGNSKGLTFNPENPLRLLKQSAEKQLDTVSKIKFTSMEFAATLDKFRNEKKVENNTFTRWLSNPFRDAYIIFTPSYNGYSKSDKFIFFLNKYSNNFGLDWVRAILFTLGISIFLFIIYTSNLQNPNYRWGWHGFAQLWKVIEINSSYYCKFLYAAHSFDFMKEFKPNIFANIIDIIGRILIGFGYYQIIKAFRKYSK